MSSIRWWGPRQIDGVGDCELKSTAGGVAYFHFQSDTEHGDRGRIFIRGGTGDFADVEGTIDVEVTVNPAKVGVPVVLVEGRKGAPATR
ncbi:hypothetical protein VSR68_23545 [Paraburkholderia phymatum]|uniref:hypothetical protein n=1 Tax=Paraburkholderia phymatum TaxID=148447 RepID=UPI00316C3F8E